jgi:hypothetical protein
MNNNIKKPPGALLMPQSDTPPSLLKPTAETAVLTTNYLGKLPTENAETSPTGESKKVQELGNPFQMGFQRGPFQLSFEFN